MQKVKRITASLLCLLLLFTVGALTACGGDPSPEAEAAFAAQYAQAILLLDAIYGEGFAPGVPVEDSNSTVAKYEPVSADCPYQTEAAFREAIGQVFSEELSQLLCYAAFEGGNESGTKARYSEENGVLTVNVRAENTLTSPPRSPSMDTIRSKSKGKNAAELTVSYLASDGSSLDKTVSMRYEGSAWKFDTLPYLAESALTE